MTLEFRWTTSRGRDTYGYNICTLYADARKVAACNGGGYDMRGTCLGDYIARAYPDRLRALTPDEMPANSHWERADPPRRICENIECAIQHAEAGEIGYLAPDAETCPHCGGATRIDYHDGKKVDDGRGFYGLRFIDPTYDPGKAIIGVDCNDRTLSNEDQAGRTVAEAEAAGVSFGLERYQAIYTATSPHATARHTVPTIDGACGMSSVEAIMRAIGLTLEHLPTRKKHDSFFRLIDARAEVTA